jgi:hypothetical protein
MSYSPFVAPFDQLPETLPVFPLPGAIVLPGNELPLNIFEPRYLNMVNDALGSHRMIGMIQPDPSADNDATLCHTGCAGRITQYRETSDGRIEMVLSGVCRFDLDDVLPTTRGYRLVVPSWSRFSDDYIDHDDKLPREHDRLLGMLKRYFEIKGLETDWSGIERLPTIKLMNSLIMALPFSDQDKQVLLETIKPEARLMTFIAILGSELQTSDSVTRH